MIDWKNLKISWSAVGHRVELSADTIGASAFMKHVIESGEGVVQRFHKAGFTETSKEVLVKKITDAGGRLVYQQEEGSNGHDQVFIWDDGLIGLDYSSQKNVSVSAICKSDAIIALCKDLCSTMTKEAKKGYVFAIVQEGNGLDLARIGFAGSPLERGNYTDDVLNRYDLAIEDLNSKDPSGRIVILDGAPGGGKTFMIKALLMDVKKAMIVIVPPSMVASLGGPELMPLLLRFKESYGKTGPIALILEDADECLAPRAGDNMPSISAILNLGDGILGSLFDVRIVATTNAKYKDLDPAIVRDMRLSQRISIKPLPYDSANTVYKRLTKSEKGDMPIPESEGGGMRPKQDKTMFSLAEVYKAARNVGWRPGSSEKKEESVNSFSVEKDGLEDAEVEHGSEYLEDGWDN